MKKIKLFLDNFIVYGLGGVINKLIPFIMLPIVTRLLPDSSYYGLSSLFNTMMMFATTFATFGMYDSMFRFFFEKDDIKFKKEICSTALLFVAGTSVLLLWSMQLSKNSLSKYFFGNEKYSYLVILASVAAITNSVGTILGAPTKMQNKRRLFLIINICSGIITYAISIVLLKYKVYENALPIGSLVSFIFIAVVFGMLNYKWFHIKHVKRERIKLLLGVAMPVVPITFIYWIFNSCDKLMITNMLSMEAAGVYSIGAKFGAISQLIYTAFSGGWQYFAYSTMKDEDQISVNAGIFEFLGMISFVSTIFLCIVIYSVFSILFEEDYISGYIVAPYLFLAPLLQMLFQILCSQFTIHGKTWLNMVFLMISASFNIIANYYLIPVMGIEGAALSTLIGYFFAVLISIYVSCKMDYFRMSKKFLLCIVVLICYFILWRSNFKTNMFVSLLTGVIVFIIYFIVYKNEIMVLAGRVKQAIDSIEKG